MPTGTPRIPLTYTPLPYSPFFRAGPETGPASVAAIVETQVGLVCKDLFAEGFGLGIEPGVAGKAILHRQHQAGVTHEGEASNGRSESPAFVMTGHGIEAMQFVAANVHPIEALFFAMPARPFAQMAASVERQTYILCHIGLTSHAITYSYREFRIGSFAESWSAGYVNLCAKSVKEGRQTQWRNMIAVAWKWKIIRFR